MDWWNVTQKEQKIDFASLPLDFWAPLLPHDTGRKIVFFGYLGSYSAECIANVKRTQSRKLR